MYLNLGRSIIEMCCGDRLLQVAVGYDMLQPTAPVNQELRAGFYAFKPLAWPIQAPCARVPPDLFMLWFACQSPLANLLGRYCSLASSAASISIESARVSPWAKSLLYHDPLSFVCTDAGGWARVSDNTFLVSISGMVDRMRKDFSVGEERMLEVVTVSLLLGYQDMSVKFLFVAQLSLPWRRGTTPGELLVRKSFP